MSLIQDLMESESPLPIASRYIVWGGIFYLFAGFGLLVWPGQVQVVFHEAAFVGHEADLARIIGMTIAIIGWLCIFSGRTGGRQVVAATVISRIILVPAVLVPLAIQGVAPNLLMTFAILDPSLAIGAWLLLSPRRAQ